MLPPGSDHADSQGSSEAILNLVETDSVWSLIPLGDIRKIPSGMVERGGGNAVSVEFSKLAVKSGSSE